MPRLAECGIAEVPLRGAGPGGARLPLHVVRLGARTSKRASEPLFLLAGGPGQAASEAFAAFVPFFEGLNLKRDLVMVDQRGTGRSAPLDCDIPGGLAEQLSADSFEDVARRCARELERDVGDYLTVNAADDLDAVRAGLGYPRIDLLGVSYGTRLALVYAARHPERARALVLDGVAPPWMQLPLSFAADAERALEAHAERCSRGACGKAFGDVRAELDAVLDALEEEPRQVSVPHPGTGEPLRFELTRDGFALALRSLLYAPELAALVPFTIARAHAGDFAPFVAQAALFTESAQEHMSLGLMLSVACNEDVAQIDPAAVEPATRGTFLGDAAVRSFREACAEWPRAEVTTDPRSPLDTPALLLSGELDPVTPPRWGDDALTDLPRGRHLVVPGMGHGVSIRSCVPKLLRQFLDAPDAVEALDASCLQDEAPPFFVDALGPEP
jgi:pimeloyl-ACP methyl ester carboxylesterase